MKEEIKTVYNREKIFMERHDSIASLSRAFLQFNVAFDNQNLIDIELFIRSIIKYISIY